jgi:hypothetical protein
LAQAGRVSNPPQDGILPYNYYTMGPCH